MKARLLSFIAVILMTLTANAQHEFVDLGLPSGTLWATTNIGAEDIYEVGDYFAWGETEPKSDYSWETYKYCKGSYTTLTKYCSNSSYGYNGFKDNLRELLPEDDAATVNWGKDWQTPSAKQWRELFDEDYTTCVQINETVAFVHVNGFKITSKQNGKYIFLPFGGRYGGTNLYYSNEGWYWSNSLLPSNPSSAQQLQSESVDKVVSYSRNSGLNIRPVRNLKEVYTEFVASTGTLTYYYDDKRASRSGITELYTPNTPNTPKDPNDPNAAVRFLNYNDKVLKGVIAPSMKYAPLTSMMGMFYGGEYKLDNTSKEMNLSSMTSIEGLGNLNTADVGSMSIMFYGCSSLTTLDLSSFGTSKVVNMHAMFNKCSSLTTLNVESFNTQNVKNMRYMFENCSSLTTLDLSSFKTDNVLNMEGMFSGCSKLQTIDISSFDLSNVTDARGMFLGCRELKTIYCDRDWSDTPAMSGGMFGNCLSMVGGRGTKYNSSFEDATYARPDGGPSAPGYFTEKGEVYTEFVESTGTLTYYYDRKRESRTGITELYLPKHSYPVRFKGYSDKVRKAVIDPTMIKAPLTSMSRMFFGGVDENNKSYDLSAMTSIKGLENLNTADVTDMQYMFLNCSSLVMLDLRSFNTQNVTNMYSMFNGCSSLTSIDLSSFNTENVTNMCSMFYDCSSVQILVTRSFNTQNVTNMATMFVGCSSLLSVDLGSFNTENVTDMNHMFDGCSSLPSINLSSFNTENVTNMGAMFSGCSSLKRLDLSSFNTSKVLHMYSMFSGCTSLTTLDLSSFNTRNVVNMAWMFKECTSLTSLDLSMFNTNSLKNTGSMFMDCSQLQTIDVSSFDLSNATDITSMFSRCSELTTIYCSNDWSKTSAKSDLMFNNCTSLVGGQGTTFALRVTDATYARPDGGQSAPGYFTEKGKIYGEVYTEFDETTGTLTYYFDTKRASRSGVTSLYDPVANPTAPRLLGFHDKVLKVVIDPSMKNAPLTSMTGMFIGGYDGETYELLFLTNLTSIEGLSNLNTADVTDMSYMFWNCSALTSLDLSSFNTQNVTNMSFMFWECKNLKTVNVSSFDVSNAKNLAAMFGGCSSLTTICCNNDWSGTTASSDGMFYGCTSLVGGQGTAFDEAMIDATYARLDGGTNAPGYFSKAPQVYTEFAEATGTLTYYYDNKLASRTGKTELYDPIGNPDASRFATYYKKVHKAVIDPSMKNAPLTSMRNMFYGGVSESWMFQTLENMTTIEGLENLNTSGVTDMNNMFGLCTALTELDLSSFNTSSVTDMGGLLTCCTALTELDLSSFNTSNVTDMGGMLMGCTALQTVDVSSFDISKVTNMNMLFSSCPNLTTIYCDNDWSTTSATSDYMFSGCYKLVGGQGTPFDDNVKDATYARPDGGTSAPGYFTTRPMVAYTVKYVDTEGNELKNARTGEAKLGTKVALTEYDKRSIFSADRESKYGYVSDNSDEVTLSANAEDNVITVTFRSLEVYYATLNCMANGSMERLAQYTGKFFEGEELDIYPALGFRGSDGKYYFTSPTKDNIKIFTFPANITPVVRGGKTYYSAVILYNEDPSVACYAEFENLALSPQDESYSFTGLGQIEGDATVFQFNFYYSQGACINLYPESYVWTEPIAEAGTYSVSIFGCNNFYEDEPKPFALGYRTAEGEVFIYSDLTIPVWESGKACTKVIEGVAIPAGASLVVMNEYSEYDMYYSEHYYDLDLDAVKLVKTGEYVEPIADGVADIDYSENAAIYNVAGQRLQKMQKGINIVGGRKILR